MNFKIWLMGWSTALTCCGLNLFNATFYAWEREFVVGPLGLGGIMIGRAFMILLCMPFVAHHIPNNLRGIFYSGGLFFTGLLMMCFVGVTSYSSLLILTIISGIGTALSSGNSGALLISFTEKGDYSTQFGIQGAFIQVGLLMGIVIGTNMSGLTLWGISGWKVGFAVIGFFHCLLGIICAFSYTQKGIKEEKHETPFQHIFKNVKVLALIGIEGGKVMVTSTMAYILLLGRLASISPIRMSILFIIFSCSVGLGQVIGGRIQDAHRLQNKHLNVTAVGLFSALIFYFSICQLMSNCPNEFVLLAIFFCLAGLIGNASNTDSLLADVLDHRAIGHGFTLLRSIQLGALTLTYGFIGVLSEHIFGYVVNVATQQNIVALAESIQTVTTMGSVAVLLLCWYLHKGKKLSNKTIDLKVHTPKDH